MATYWLWKKFQLNWDWVISKYDHVWEGIGTIVNRPVIKKYQNAIKVEARSVPEHHRSCRVQGSFALVGDATGYVTKYSGEGIYFPTKLGRMDTQKIVALMKNESRLPTQIEI